VAQKKSRRSNKTVQFYPNAEELKKLKAGLPPPFPSHDVTSVFQLPIAEAKKEAGRVTSSVIEGQLDDLLRALGLTRSTPDAWRKGFQLLAMIHHGTAHFFYDRPRKPNRNATKWRAEHDRLLYTFVNDFEKEGVFPTVALRAIAKDQKKWSRLPLSSKPRSEKSDDDLRYEAFRKQWTRISKMAPPGSLLAAIVGDYPVNGSEKDKVNWRPKLSDLPALEDLGKSNAP
jgi:hypothetical protein